MPIEVHVETVVLPGGRIEIVVPRLVAGQRATVVVMVEDQKPVEQGHVIDLLSALPGHQLFENADEVDAYLCEERNVWED